MRHKGDSGTGECSSVGGLLAYHVVSRELDPQHVYESGVVMHTCNPIITTL